MQKLHKNDFYHHLQQQSLKENHGCSREAKQEYILSRLSNTVDELKDEVTMFL